MIKIDELEISYNGSNGWYYRAAGQSLTAACCPNDRFGDGESIITMSGRVLATPGRAAIKAEIAEFEAARQARVASAASPVRRQPARDSSVSAFEFRNLVNSLGASAAADMARQMRG